MSDELHRAIAALWARLDDIEDAICALCQQDRWIEAAELYAEFEGLRSAMGKRGPTLAETIAETMPAQQVEVPGVGVMTRRRGTVRKAWDWPTLLPKAIRSYLDPDGTGEFPTDPMTAVDRMRAMAEDVIGLTPSKQPRVGALRALDIDPDEYCESTPGRLSVQITQAGA